MSVLSLNTYVLLSAYHLLVQALHLLSCSCFSFSDASSCLSLEKRSQSLWWRRSWRHPRLQSLTTRSHKLMWNFIYLVEKKACILRREQISQQLLSSPTLWAWLDRVEGHCIPLLPLRNSAPPPSPSISSTCRRLLALTGTEGIKASIQLYKGNIKCKTEPLKVKWKPESAWTPV